MINFNSTDLILVKSRTQKYYSAFFILFFCSFFGQNISLYNQFNGRYDFIFIGNTMNNQENNSISGEDSPLCDINTSSSATLNLNTGDVIENAYLYWAGSGTGDFDIKLNGQNINAQRTFSVIQLASQMPFFSAFANVTQQVINTGNGNYTVSDLDLNSIIADYCPFGGNFAGWALVIVYKNNALPINQLNVYDGMQSVPTAITINLNSLNVIDNANAKIGFVAWEGDKNIAVNETLTINGNVISNPPLNPPDNAFNGTNSFTGSNQLYNMDLDVYSIQNNINIGDTSAQIQLTSGQDFVMVNAVVTKLNSQLPDATVIINDVEKQCNSKQLIVHYTVSNFNATNPLLAGTPIAIYVNNQLIGQGVTQNNIPVDGSETGQITITIPDSIPNTFDITIIADNDGTGHGIRIEINETNNSFTQNVSFLIPPTFNLLNPLKSCNEGLTSGTFNFLNYNNLVLANTTDTFAGYYENYLDAFNHTNPILNPSNYIAFTTPKEIFIRVENATCFAVTSFLLTTKNCPPTVYNYISANNDNTNDTFVIDGLRNIFLNFDLEIYNRWGRLIWTGNNNTSNWDGFSNQANRLDNDKVQEGTYYYILNLNDPDFQEPLNGWLYFSK
ncbi:MAG: gliding motility-associated C-terminal domain-containing protein [Flavobacterium sp.]|nr:gliding motility-associated C-terminal domain-containing protein [Flavobacterium sp.]